jgi:dCTP deaminase
LFSDEDIKKALEEYNNNPEDGLLIEPFDRKYLSPVGYDLRVGKQGFSWNKKRIINIESEGRIQIDANDTVVIQTLESLTLSKKVAATVHSVVSKIITKGLSDISTTIDPGYTGKLLISVHNYRDSSTELRFQEYFCTVCFYKVDLESKINLNRSIDRDELWEQLLEKAEDERKRIEQAKSQQESQIKNANRSRKIQLIFFIFIALTGGIATSVINPTLGSSLAGFLAVIAPIVYDMLKPISK